MGLAGVGYLNDIGYVIGHTLAHRLPVSLSGLGITLTRRVLMSELIKEATHNRLLTIFKAVGPYLREEQCQDGLYWFDCLAFCINDKKSPEKREFWGWWMELARTESGFEAHYHIGRYNQAGDWESKTPTAEALPEVVRTQHTFHQKLTDTLAQRFALSLTVAKHSAEFA